MNYRLFDTSIEQLKFLSFKLVQTMVNMAQPTAEDQFEIKVNQNSKPNRNSSCSFRPVYIVSRILGQMPFSIVYNVNGEIHRPIIKKLDIVWIIIPIGIYIYDMYRACASEYFDLLNKGSSEVMFVGFIFISVIVHFLGFLTIILDICYRFKLVDIFKKMTNFDKKAS